jgi:hypothetical protein
MIAAHGQPGRGTVNITEWQPDLTELPQRISLTWRMALRRAALDDSSVGDYRFGTTQEDEA